jgi:hypothetical protein
MLQEMNELALLKMLMGVQCSVFSIDEIVKSSADVMPGLTRHPEPIDNTGQRWHFTACPAFAGET